MSGTSQPIPADWAQFIDAHNQPQRARYHENQFAPPTEAVLSSAVNKILKAAQFPDLYTVNLTLANLSQNETSAVLHYFDRTGVHSTMEWSGSENAPRLTIRDGNNVHLSSSPVQIIKDWQKKIFAPEQAAQPYIPPFNVIFPGKGIYTLLDYMHPADVELLEKAFTANNIPFERKFSHAAGDVHQIPFAHVEAVSQMLKTARTEANHERMPSKARFGHSIEGCPINLLYTGGENHIPLEGMSMLQLQQIRTNLEQAHIPFVQKMTDISGLVLAVADEHLDQLETLRKRLRNEYNGIKVAQDAKRTTTTSGSSLDLDLS